MASDLRDHIQSMLGSGYHVSKELGGGGMSRVFIADDEALGQRVVVKVLPPELAAGVNAERFRREIQVAAQLHHRNIVPVLSAGQTSELLWYTMPFIEGETLRALLDRERQLPFDVALCYTRDIAAALTCAHAQNIVHRDIKPENILIENGRALVADFGIARAIEKSVTVKSVTSTGLTLGTPTYMSPEQAAAEKHLDGRSDTYSLGCVVYEMLAGEPPFTGPSTRTVIAKHLNERPPSVLTTRPNLPPHVEKALYIALAKAPADRFATAQEFADALERPDETDERAIPVWPRRRRWPMALAFTAVGVLVGGFALWLLPTRHPAAAVVADPARIAVLPFEVPGGDPELGRIGRGLSYDLIDALRGAPGVTVISYYAIQALGPATPIDSIRRRFAVGTIVAGTLERTPTAIVLRARLIDATSLTDRSAFTKALPPASILELRDTLVAELGHRVLAQLGPALRVERWRSTTRSRAAWELRQRAQDELNREASMVPAAASRPARLLLFARADSLLALASREDPRWAEPLVARGWLYMRRTAFESVSATNLDLDSAASMAAQALALGTDDARARSLRGAARFNLWAVARNAAPGLLDSAKADLTRALAEDSTLASGWNTLSAVLRMQNDTAGALMAVRRAMAVDAFAEETPETISRLFFAYLFAQNFGAARSLCDEYRATYARNLYVATCELTLLGYSGSGPAAVDRTWTLVRDVERDGWWGTVAGIAPYARLYAAAVLARSGAGDSARAVLASVHAHIDSTSQRDDYLVPYAQVYTLLGDTAAALDALERAVRARPTRRDQIGRLPWFIPLKDAPRFRALIGKPTA